VAESAVASATAGAAAGRAKRLDYKVMQLDRMVAACRSLNLEPSPTIVATAATLERHFRANTKKNDISTCSTCGAKSDFNLPSCPYCGDGEKTVPGSDGKPVTFSDDAGALESIEAAPAAPPPEVAEPAVLTGWPALRERLELARDAVLVPTGIAPLDGVLRGGLRTRRLMVVAGPPESGKTTLAAQIGRNMARNGIAVGQFDLDDPGGFDVRNLMSVGIVRGRAEKPDEATIKQAEAALGALPLEVIADDEDEIAAAFEKVAAAHPASTVAVVVDSLQKAAELAPEDSARGRVDSVLKELRALAKQHEAVAIATSEVSRAAYRSRRPKDAIDPMAAPKESGGIEYGADVLLILTSPAGEPDLVDVFVSKNRLGRSKESFRLRLDRERATFEPVAEAPEQSDDARDEQVLALVTANPKKSGSELAKLAAMKRQDLFTSLERLEAAKRIANAGTAPRPKWVAAEEASP
jgi:KaiC/GvpD/RAD55 family RecA-like ATPase